MVTIFRRGSRNFRPGGGGVPTFKKKTLKKKGGEAGRFSIYSALIRSKSNLAIETAFRTIAFINMASPGVFDPPKHI